MERLQNSLPVLLRAQSFFQGANEIADNGGHVLFEGSVILPGTDHYPLHGIELQEDVGENDLTPLYEFPLNFRPSKKFKQEINGWNIPSIK